jgi:hypothetical protein
MLVAPSCALMIISGMKFWVNSFFNPKFFDRLLANKPELDCPSANYLE